MTAQEIDTGIPELDDDIREFAQLDDDRIAEILAAFSEPDASDESLGRAIPQALLRLWVRLSEIAYFHSILHQTKPTSHELIRSTRARLLDQIEKLATNEVALKRLAAVQRGDIAERQGIATDDASRRTLRWKLNWSGDFGSLVPSCSITILDASQRVLYHEESPLASAARIATGLVQGIVAAMETIDSMRESGATQVKVDSATLQNLSSIVLSLVAAMKPGSIPMELPQARAKTA